MNASRKRRKIKRIDKISLWTKKYQSLIQSIGILFVLITLFITIYQTYLTRKDVDIALKNSNLNEQTGWNVLINYPTNDVLKENISFESKNSNITIQKVTFFIVEKRQLYSYATYKSKFKINPLKKTLERVYNDCYSFNYEIFYHLRPLHSTSYPIAILFQYEIFGKIEYECLLYELHYDVYAIKQNEVRIKTTGIEYKQKLEYYDSVYLTKQLIDYNVKHCFLSDLEEKNIDSYLKKDLIKKDSTLKYLYDFIGINLKTTCLITSYQSPRDSSEILATVRCYLPTCFIDSILAKRLINVVEKLNEFPIRDKEINLMLDSIHITRNKFIIPDSMILLKKEVFLNKITIKEWERMNLKLENILFKKVEF